MNLFQKYGIKEVADVTFYSITSIGDEVVYTPVLFLDTLKVSTIEKSGQKVSAEGGKGNKKLISWNYGKEFSLNLEDALFSPASMSMIISGRLKGKFSDFMSAIVKANIANKYGLNNYSPKAYPSPAPTDEEWEVIFKAEQEVTGVKYIPVANDSARVAEHRETLKKQYFGRTRRYDNAHKALSQDTIEKILSYIDELSKIGTIQTDNHNLEVVDRFERCTVREKTGFSVSTKEQKENLLKYYQNDKSSNYVIYYDPKTMLPLLHVDHGKIQGWSDDNDLRFTLPVGTGYLKWSRTVKYVNGENEGSLGNVLVIDAETFSGDYKIVCETYIRNQKTGQDQRYQIQINRAQINSDTSITLQADGDPTTFSMQIDVLSPQNGDLIEMKQFNVDEDAVHGGFRVIAQDNQYTHANTKPVSEKDEVDDVINGEIY